MLFSLAFPWLLMMSIKHFSHVLLANYIYPFEVSFSSFAHLFIGLFVILLFNFFEPFICSGY
jgi:hypothetical protein